MRPASWLLPLLLIAGLSACAMPAPGLDDRARIAGRTYVVTGASSGFGRGVAVRLGSLGANVVLAARRTAVLEEAAVEVRAGGGQALVVTTDVSQPEAVEALARAAVARFGRIDVWINDAAVASLGRFEETPVEDHARVMAVNLGGVLYGSHAALRQFRVQSFGTLVNVSSVEGRVPLAYHASYAATKHAILGLGAALNQELRLNGLRDRVQVVTVLPWAADTPFWDHAGNYTGRTPRGPQMGGAQEVADAIVWVSVHPRAEFAVGWRAEGVLLGHRLWPGLTERVASDVIQRVQIEQPPPAPATAGSVHAPMPAGTTVEGGTRVRVEREDAERRVREGR